MRSGVKPCPVKEKAPVLVQAAPTSDVTVCDVSDIDASVRDSPIFVVLDPLGEAAWTKQKQKTKKKNIRRPP